LFQAINYVMTSATIYAGRELECPLEIEILNIEALG
jgi:hypothetical protein